MKNKTKTILLIIFLLFLCILAIQYKRNIKEINDFKGLPNLSDYQSLSESEKINVIKKVDSIPMDDAVKSLKARIVDYAKKENLVDLITLDIYKDNLLMYENQNKKQFNNLFINIELAINNKDITMSREEAEDISYKINKEIYNLCNSDTYGFLKLNTVYTNFIDNKNKANFEYVNSNTIVSEIVNLNQSEEELETQNIVYNFVQEHKNFSLKKFGIIDNTKELYIEIPIYDIYDKENQNTILQNLQSISDSLYNKIESKKYIQINNLDTITISFYTPWNKDKFITYNYKLQQ